MLPVKRQEKRNKVQIYDNIQFMVTYIFDTFDIYSAMNYALIQYVSPFCDILWKLFNVDEDEEGKTEFDQKRPLVSGTIKIQVQSAQLT